MMKRNLFIGMILLVAGLLASCDKRPSYPEMKRQQQKAIDKFISQQGFEILHKYPSNGIFKEKQFYLTDNGVYINVVDSGNGTRPKQNKTLILMRCRIQNFFQVDTPKTFNFFANEYPPFEFTFGEAASIVYQNRNNGRSVYYSFFSESIEDALSYVGDNSVVKLIVPFERGSTYQTQHGIPLYYDRVTFKFY